MTIGSPNPQRDKFPVIPGYHLETILGRGATGEVYKAVQLSVNRQVALKVLRSELVGTSKAVQRLQREARNTARLHHPNIISAIDMGEVSGRWWYAMELVAGPSLSRRIKRDGALSEREALRMFTPLAAALQHLFEQGIVHRDIKPANIVLEEGGRSLLIDLGLAFSEEDPSITRGGGTLGTPHYISPEQARDPSSADVRSDIWSLGATMYHTVCGEPPFVGASVAEIMSRVLYSRVPDPLARAPHLSRGYSMVLRKCLARDPERRYQTPAELQEDLERLRERRAPQITRKELDPLLLEGPSPWRIAALVAAGVLLLVSGWLAFARPWENTTNPEQPALLTEWKPLEDFAAADVREPSRLGARYHELLEINRTTPERFADRANALLRGLEQQIERELSKFKRGIDRGLNGHLEASEYQAARELLDEQLEADLVAATGFRADNLPELRRLEFGNWLDKNHRRLDEAVETREMQFKAQVELHLENTRRDVRTSQDRNRWNDAQRMLGDDFGGWLAASNAIGDGIPPARRAELLAAVELQRNMLKQRFENGWYEVDTGLKRFVSERARQLTSRTRDRELENGAEKLQQEFDQELKRQGLREEWMPSGLSRYGLDELALQKRALTELEAEIADEDAKTLLRSLQSENSELWSARRYAEIAADLSQRSETETRASLRWAMTRVRREAELLQALLERTAARIEDLDGDSVTVALGSSSIQVTGRLRAGVDPLGRGFEIVAGRSERFLLAGPVEQRAHLVSSRDVRLFSGLGLNASSIADDESRLTLALFLYREGEPLAALEVLSSGSLPREFLSEDLEERIRVTLLRDTENKERELAVAKHDLALLQREWRAPHDKKRLLDKCHALLTDFSNYLSPDELVEVRSIQSALRAIDDSAPTLEEFERIFAPESVEFVGSNQVRMQYRFDEPEVGAWDLGVWRRSAFGWDCPPGIPSVEGHDGPSLILRRPFDVNKGVVELELEVEQLAPARLFAVSAVGFHVLFSGGADSKCLVHSGTLAEAAARVREGEGRPYAGFARDGRYSLRFQFNKASGDVNIWIDGQRFDRRKDMRASPIGQASSNNITLRSISPLRLISATIQGWHD